MCAHTAMYVSSYCFICGLVCYISSGLIRFCMFAHCCASSGLILLHMCPPAALYLAAPMLLYMRPHTAVYVCSYRCVLRSFETDFCVFSYCCICVVIPVCLVLTPVCIAKLFATIRMRRNVRQYLHVCTSKARKLSTWTGVYCDALCVPAWL